MTALKQDHALISQPTLTQLLSASAPTGAPALQAGANSAQFARFIEQRAQQILSTAKVGPTESKQ